MGTMPGEHVELVERAGVELGRVRTVTEAPIGGSEEQLAYAGDAASSPVPIAPGTQELMLTVTVVFDIS